VLNRDDSKSTLSGSSKQPRENLGIENVVPQIECKATIGYKI
jgi:hypothetical protein